MDENEATRIATKYKENGYDVMAAPSPIASRGWEIRAVAADGGRPLYAFTERDLKILVLGAQIAKR